MPDPALIYLHGLNSSGSAAKAVVFRERLAPLPVLSPSYPAHRPHAAVTRLRQYLEQQARHQELALIGSSMGGFYGQFLARLLPVRHLYLINPALRPWELLPRHLGPQYNPATGEHYELTMEVAQATRSYRVDQVCDGVATTLFLDQGDGLIDYRIAAELYRRCARVHAYPGGDHLFQHMAEAVALIRADYGL